MNTFQVHIYHANSPFYEGECESLILPTTEGDYGILANHSNMIAAVVPGTMTYRLPGQPAQLAAVSAGLVKVEDNDVLVLVDSAERPEEIDINRAERAIAEAKEAMLQKKTVQEYKMAQAHLACASSARSARKEKRNNGVCPHAAAGAVLRFRGAPQGGGKKGLTSSRV